MIPLRLAELAGLVGGRLHPPEAGDVLVDGPVVTDSREAGPGSLYIARIGEHTDGHRFVGSARDAGAVAALTSREVHELACVVVPDVQAAFAALATCVVARVPGLTVVAITGSSGKTTTKDLLAAVLSRHAPTVANVGSYNTEVGVPLTACRVGQDTRFLILEMGARGIGHLRYLTDMVRPDIAVVLNVGTAHAGEFGGREVTARAKGELVEALGPDGVAVLNVDDPLVAAMAARTRARVVRTGLGRDADVWATGVHLDRGRPRFTLQVRRRSAGRHPGDAVGDVVSDAVADAVGDARGEAGTPAEAKVALTVLGEHQVHNALAVAAVALVAGMPLPGIAAALSEAGVPSRYRMELHERPDGLTVLNDAYNANPESVGSALRTLAQLGRSDQTAGPSTARRTWAVLGEMLELGAESEAAHEQLGRLAVRLGVDRVVAVGPGTRALARAAAPVSSWVPDSDGAWELLAREYRPGDVILVKASNGIGLWALGDRLAREGLPA
ncbi:MAG TPA: UDP-N-acetylmuramoyl-tripeptide--D-alanyl-D-alanine ligase [Dermatophilaceae bacterium]|nr:UDP-N-acetylmuramoyl-tripeptide--D-alanyl-D-alanine ligase [Dermatophilaceae bacterium]